jgi:hypothetical protein
VHPLLPHIPVPARHVSCDRWHLVRVSQPVGPWIEALSPASGSPIRIADDYRVQCRRSQRDLWFGNSPFPFVESFGFAWLQARRPYP